MNKHVVLYIFVFLCKNMVLQIFNKFVNCTILIAKKQLFIFLVVVLSGVILTSDHRELFRIFLLQLIILNIFIILKKLNFKLVSILNIIYLKWQETSLKFSFLRIIKITRKGQTKKIATKYSINK